MNLYKHYRKNQYRHKRDYTYPGNFRKPTLGQCRQYLDEWEAEGVTSLDDFDNFEFENAQEAELVKIRWSEANRYWKNHEEALQKYDEAVAFKEALDAEGIEGTPELPPEVEAALKKGKPEIAYPTGEDYGDFEPTNKDGAIRYLTQFFSQNAEREAKGLEPKDPTKFPFLPRYAEAVTLLGLPEVAKIHQHVEKLHAEHNLERAKKTLQELKEAIKEAETDVSDIEKQKAQLIKIGEYIDQAKTKAEAVAAKAAKLRAKKRHR